MKFLLCLILIASSAFACAPNKPKPKPKCSPFTTTRAQCVTFVNGLGEDGVDGEAVCGTLTATDTTNTCDTAPHTTLYYNVADEPDNYGQLASTKCVNGQWEFTDGEGNTGHQKDYPSLEVYCVELA